MQRTFIIIAVVVVALGVGVAVYFSFFNTPSVVVAPEGSTTLPVAGQNIPGTETTINTITAPLSVPVTVSARLVQISKGPVVPGEAVVNIQAKNASSTGDVAVTYIERESGNVFSYLVHAKTLTRTSNKTVPGIQSAAWLPDASLAFVRYLSGPECSTVNTSARSASSSSGFFLPQKLSDVAVSSTNILMLASGVNGSIASLSRADGTRPSEIFTTPLSSLRISFAGKNKYLAFTKPTATLSGSAFVVDGTGSFSRVAGPLNGLVARASSSGTWVLVSHTLGNKMQMNLINTTTGDFLPLPVATIADKCVWTADESAVYCGVPTNPSENAQYPDDWYQGAVSFSDRIWKIDVAGRFAQFVLDFSKETNAILDAEALALDPLNTVLVFINKNDGSLWSYSL